MKSGRELDALVAEKVMGIKDVRITKGLGPVYDFTGTQGMPRKTVPHYSTDIAAAWDVINQHHFAINLHRVGAAWYVKLDGEFEAAGESAPHAICLAALKAVGGL
jgi:hypothetical protein